MTQAPSRPPPARWWIGRARSDAELDDLRPKTSRPDVQARPRDRQREAARPGASGIEQQEAIPALDARSMGVAGDDDVDTLALRIAAELREVVHDAQARTTDPGHHDLGERGGPGLAVVVAAHGDDRREAAEPVENRAGADVARVHDQVGARQAATTSGRRSP